MVNHFQQHNATSLSLSLWQAACVNVLRIMQRVTKSYPQRIQHSLVKYNSSIVLNNLLISSQHKDGGSRAAVTYYVLKLFKSQVRYIPKSYIEFASWREENINIINGISKNIRIGLCDNWLVIQDPTGALGLGGSPGEGMHHPTELTTKWAVHRFLNRNRNVQDRMETSDRNRNPQSLSLSALSMLTAAMSDSSGSGYGDDRTIESGPDGMLCLDGVDGTSFVSEITSKTTTKTKTDDEGDLMIDGVGVYALYNDPATDVPHYFLKSGAWSKWLSGEKFLQQSS